MKKYTINIVLFSIFLITGNAIVGQSNQGERPLYKFHRLNEYHGLSNNIINDILQDQLGYIWIATDDGLFRYDGSTFHRYKNEPGNDQSLPHNSVQAIYLEEDNSLWALTDYGIGIYDHETDHITRILPGTNPENIPHKSVTSITGDQSGAKFIGTFGGGVILAKDQQYSQLVPFSNPDSIYLEDQLVIQVYLDRDSVLWIGTWNDGLLQVDLKYGSIRQLDLSTPTPLRIFTIYHNQDNQIWIGTNQGLFVFNESDKKPLHFSSKTHDWLQDDEVLSIYQDDNKVIWLGTRNAGLLSVTQGNVLGEGELNVQRYSPSSHSGSVSHRTISKIFQDNSGNIWLGTHNSGINVFDPNGEIVKYFTHVPDELSLSHQSVWGIAEDRDNTLWVGTDGGGVNWINPYNQEIKTTPTNGFSGDAILCALKSKSGKIWFGTYSGGINVHNPETGKTRVFNTSNGLQGNDVRALFEATDGKIWIGTNSSGLHVYNSQTNKISHVASTNNMDIRDIESGSDGELWLASFGDGLIQFNVNSEEVITYNWYPEGEYTPVAFTAFFDGQKVWVGTRQNGLLQFDPQDKTFQAFTESHGLLSNTVRAIIQDDFGHIWASTNVGISCFIPEEKRFRNFDTSHGLQLGRFNDRSVLKLENGDLVFGGIHGLNVFNPRELLATEKPPDLVFSELKLEAKAHNPSTDIKLSSTQKIKINYNQNTFTIGFNALSYPFSDAWHFDVTLSDYDTDWYSNGQNRSVTYRNVPPGDYTFRIRSSDISGSIKGEINSIDIAVRPPWWRTWQAYFGYLILLGVLIYLFVRYSNRQIKLEQRLIYEQKTRQQEKDSMQQKLRFYTNFSHELRTPLTLIQGPIKDLIKLESLKEHRPLLYMINRNTNTLLKLLNRLLEFRKIETEKTILNIGEYDLSVLAQEEAESFGYQASKMGIGFNLETDPEVYTWVDIEKLQIILNNLLSNAIKYTQDGGSINFSLKKKDQGVLLEIQDTGSGIPESEREAVFTPFYQAENSSGKGGTGIGLALTRRLVELHGGSIQLDSNSSGSKFTIDLPKDRSYFESQKHVRFIEGIEQEELLNLAELEESYTDEKPTALIADDNADIREYINEQLKLKYRVLSAIDGEEALDIAVKELPDIIISDIMMPGMNGIELCKKLKEKEATNHIPVVLLTAKDAEESKVEGYKSGADSYITKPFSSELLLVRIQNLLEQRARMRELLAKGEWEQEAEVENSPELKFIKHVEETIIAIIEQSDITVPGLARELGFSRTSLYRKIKALTGLSINQFIRMVKLKRAALLLKTSSDTVSEIAFGLGFTDLKYFRTCFKDQLGILPSEYRKQFYSNDISPTGIRDAMDMN